VCPEEAPISNGTVHGIVPRLACSLLLVFTGVQMARAEPQGLTGAKSEAAALEAKLKELKDQAKTLTDTYNAANEQLAQSEADAATNADLLAKAQDDQASAESALNDRLAAIYKQGRGSSIDVLLSSSSWSELVNRATLLQRVSEQDAALLEQVTAFRAEVAERGDKLTAQLEAQQALTQQVETARQAMDQKVAEAAQVLKGKEAEVAQLQKEWKAAQEKQARLEREREARLAAALAAAQAAAQSHSGNGSNNGGGSGGSGSTGSTTTTTKKPTGSTTTTTSGGGTGGGTGTYHPGVANVLKPEQIALVAQKAGFSGESLVIAVAVAMAESSSDANAIGRLKTYGLWQIYSHAHPDMINPSNPDASRWFDPYVNAKFAYKIAKGGATWRPWSVYTSGAYLSRMAKARVGVELLLNNPSAVTPPTVK
jgi:peptidoglycan hydrolase CwlO-like protein